MVLFDDGSWKHKWPMLNHFAFLDDLNGMRARLVRNWILLSVRASLSGVVVFPSMSHVVRWLDVDHCGCTDVQVSQGRAKREVGRHTIRKEPRYLETTVARRRAKVCVHERERERERASYCLASTLDCVIDGWIKRSMH
jgi:hypothetical protein